MLTISQPVKIIQSEKGNQSPLPPDFERAIAQKINLKAAASFQVFYSALLIDIKTKKLCDIVQASDIPFYILRKEKSFKYTSHEDLYLILKKPGVNHLLARVSSSPSNLTLLPEGIIWGDGELLFSPQVVGDTIVWKLTRLILPD